MISVVVPAYDSAVPLRSLLAALARQADGNGFEVIVVDDGSADDTRDVVRSFESDIRGLRYIHRARDQRSCRARARNLGLEASRGELVVFLDASVLVGPSFLPQVRVASRRHPGSVLVMRTLGLFASAAGRSAPPQPHADLDGWSATLMSQREWEDPRDPLLDSFQSHSVPAPWMLAWTCALAVPRAAAVDTGGFDDRFLGWGVEDVDFARRIAAAGCPIIGLREPTVVHWPHADAVQEARAARAQNHARNAYSMFQRAPSLETELFAALTDGFAANILLARLEALDLRLLLPPLTDSARQSLRAVLAEMGAVALIGLRDPESVAPALGCEILVHATRAVPGSVAGSHRVHRLLGCYTPFSSASIDHAVLGELVRLLPDELAQAVIAEAARVATFLCLPTCHLGRRTALYLASGGWTWRTDDEMAALVEPHGRAIRHAGTGGGVTVFRTNRPS